eukprot:m.196198 g.196198  ORF g.196198 m.196198 type:complete len:87 (-) comp14903_c1_seq2:146-406(-)
MTVGLFYFVGLTEGERYRIHLVVVITHPPPTPTLLSLLCRDEHVASRRAVYTVVVDNRMSVHNPSCGFGLGVCLVKELNSATYLCT